MPDDREVLPRGLPDGFEYAPATQRADEDRVEQELSEGVRTDRRGVLGNAAASWLGFALQAVITFLVIPILVRGLGDEGYGTWSLLQAALAYLVLLELNVSDAVIRYIARYQERDDASSTDKIFSTSLCLFTAAGAAAALVTTALCAFETPLGVAAERADEVRRALAILGAGVAVALPLRVFPAVLEGLGRYPTLNLVETAAALIRGLLLAWAVTRGRGLVDMAIVVASLLVAQGVFMAWLARAAIPTLRFRPSSVDRATLALIAAYASPAVLIVLAGQISLHSDALVIGAFLDPRSITYFVLAAGLIDQARRALTAVVTVLTPTVSALDSAFELEPGDSKERAREQVSEIFLEFAAGLSAVAVPAAIAAVLLGHSFLTLWVGPSYAEASHPVLSILAVALPSFAIQVAAARVLFGIGRLRFLAIVSVAEALSNVGLSIALLGSMGIVGVALGTAIPSVFQALATTGYVCRVLGISLRRALRAIGLPVLMASPLPACVWWWASTSYSLDSWPGFLAAALAGTAAGAPWFLRGIARARRLN